MRRSTAAHRGPFTTQCTPLRAMDAEFTRCNVRDFAGSVRTIRQLSAAECALWPRLVRSNPFKPFGLTPPPAFELDVGGLYPLACVRKASGSFRTRPTPSTGERHRATFALTRKRTALPTQSLPRPSAADANSPNGLSCPSWKVIKIYPSRAPYEWSRCRSSRVRRMCAGCGGENWLRMSSGGS